MWGWPRVRSLTLRVRYGSLSGLLRPSPPLLIAPLPPPLGAPTALCEVPSLSGVPASVCLSVRLSSSSRLSVCSSVFFQLSVCLSVAPLCFHGAVSRSRGNGWNHGVLFFRRRMKGGICFLFFGLQALLTAQVGNQPSHLEQFNAWTTINLFKVASQYNPLSTWSLERLCGSNISYYTESGMLLGFEAINFTSFIFGTPEEVG